MLLGADGQLGYELVKRINRNHVKNISLYPFAHHQLDICQPDQLKAMIDKVRPGVIINAAAYTDVEGAERNKGAAVNVNQNAVAALAAICQDGGIRLVHLSTDYVFSGKKNAPYTPYDEPSPINTYGRTKYNGELAVLENTDRIVIRTAWMYSSHHRNFLTSMLQLFNDKKLLRVVDDQVGTPTYAVELAAVVEAAALNDCNGIYHWSDRGCASWYDFANYIGQKAYELGVLDKVPKIEPVSSAEYSQLAVRPKYSVLEIGATEKSFNLQAKPWQQNVELALRQVIKEN